MKLGFDKFMSDDYGIAQIGTVKDVQEAKDGKGNKVGIRFTLSSNIKGAKKPFDTFGIFLSDKTGMKVANGERIGVILNKQKAKDDKGQPILSKNGKEITNLYIQAMMVEAPEEFDINDL